MDGSFGDVYVGQEVDQEFFGDKPGQQEDRSTDRGVREVLAGEFPYLSGFRMHLVVSQRSQGYVLKPRMKR